MKKIMILSALFAITSSMSLAGNSNAGKSAYSFLKVGVGAKSQAMAGAFVGLADDISSLYYNPAGLTAVSYKISSNRFIATYMNYLLDFQTGFLGYAKSLNYKTALGASIHYQSYGTFTRYDFQGNDLGTFGAWDFALGLTYSKRLARGLSIGATTKFIIEHIEDYSSDAIALDLGALYRLADGRTGLGLAITNTGFQLKGLTKSHKDPLPLVVEGGFAHRLKGLPLTFAADLTFPSDNDVFFAIGGQWESFKPFFIRLGWSSTGSDYKTGSDKDSYAGLAGGFGYQHNNYIFDYSYSSYADLGNVHRFTLSAGF